MIIVLWQGIPEFTDLKKDTEWEKYDYNAQRSMDL